MCFYCEREVKGNPQFWWYLNYVCWNCRVQNGVTKNPVKNSDINTNGRICYRCHQQMTEVGFKFRTPKKNNIKEWSRLQKTWENQYKYDENGNKIYVGPKSRIVKQQF
jgi:hypothetical protein